MTDKEDRTFWGVVLLLSAFVFGVGIGGTITSLRYDADIRTDQLELKDQVAEIIEDKAIIEDIIDTLLFNVDQLKLERQELRELKILLSKGE